MTTLPPRLRPIGVVRIEPEPWSPPAPAPQGLRSPRRWIPLAVLALASVIGFFWLLTLATPVTLATDPANARVRVATTLQLPIGNQILLLPGVHRLTATAAGHRDLERSFNVLPDLETQVVEVVLQRTPGQLVADLGGLDAVTVSIDGGPERPLTEPFEVEAGRHELTFDAPRHLPRTVTVDVQGMGRRQPVEVELTPGFGTLAVTTTPVPAAIWFDGEPIGTTAAPVEIDVGNHLIELRADGYRPLRLPAEIRTGAHTQLPAQTLEPADALLALRTVPAGASVTINDDFKGVTPLQVALRPDRVNVVELYLSGHEVARRELTFHAEETRELELTLQPVLGQVDIDVTPEQAVVSIDGRRIGTGDQRLRLPARPHALRVDLAGHAAFTREIIPRDDLPLALDVRLLTDEEARWARLPATIQSANGDVLRLFRTGTIEMGAQRRQPGRRRNEVERTARITRGYYLATREVTNAQYRRFRPQHDSRFFKNVNLNEDSQPVVRVGWEDAVAYCNWLSTQEGLDPVYRIRNGEVVGFDPGALGYRLPTEAEWALATRRAPDGGVLIFPWGDEPTPPRRAGNLADRSAAYMLPDTLRDYGDGFVATAPVAAFPADPAGLFDVAGNVAEWMNDFYGEDPAELGGIDPLGPAGGDYHVIRGSSWRHGTIVELRTSFRDYGIDGRVDLGFRVARYAE